MWDERASGQVRECYRFVDQVLTSSDSAQQFVKLLSESSKGMPNIMCTICKSNDAFLGYYDAPTHKVLLCANELQRDSGDVTLLQHELIHAFDHTVLGLDFGREEELACSEIRAAAAADCASVFFRQRCTRDAAVRSSALAMRNASDVVDRVWGRCYPKEAQLWSDPNAVSRDALGFTHDERVFSAHGDDDNGEVRS